MRQPAGMLAFIADIGRFALYSGRRFGQDGCPQAAATLTYVTLLALVPLAALGIAAASLHPVFVDLHLAFQEFVFSNFLPEAVYEVHSYFLSFVDNARRLTTVGLVALVLAAFFLLGSMETAFNQIWRVRRPRPWPARVGVFAMLLTVGPLLFGSSFVLSSYLFALATWGGIKDVVSPLAPFAPALFTLAGFALLYAAVPYRQVDWRHAGIGAVVATLLLEALKFGFNLYIAWFPTYQAIYGALSAFPILLIWTYMGWLVVLLGAVVAAALPEWRRRARQVPNAPFPTGERLGIALGIIAALAGATANRRGLARTVLLDQIAAPPDHEEAVLELLARHGFAARVGRDRWRLACDPAQATLHQLCVALDVLPVLPPAGMAAPQIDAALAPLDRAAMDATQITLDRLLAPDQSTTNLARTS